MSVIDGEIAPANYELILERICEILADEIAEQSDLAYRDEDAEFLGAVTVWKERLAAFNQSDMPAINVSLASGTFANQTQKQTDGTYIFFIDGHTKAATRSSTDRDERGDTRATLKLHKLMWICQAIIENPQYKTLGFAAPSISNRRIESLNISDPGKQDNESTIMGRLQLSVRVPEQVELLTAGTIAGNDTTVKLYETDFGYYYSTGEED